MAARYKTISGLLGFVDPIGSDGTARVDIEIASESTDAGPSRKTRKRDSLRVMSVRNLVNKIETRAVESLERNFGGRFSGRLRKPKVVEEGPASASASASVVGREECPKNPHNSGDGQEQQQTTWYMVHLSPGREEDPTVPTLDDLQQHDDNQRTAIEGDKISADSAEFSEW